MHQGNHQQDHQGDDSSHLTVGLDTADDVFASLIDRVGTAGQTEVVSDGSTGHHAEHSHSGVAVAAASQDQLTQGAAAQQHGAPAHDNHAHKVPQVCAVGNRLALEAQLEAAGSQIADEGDDKDGHEAVQQLEILEHDAVTDAFAKALDPIIAGGTGSASDSEYLPEYLPDRFESGTPNLPGIYGWEAALRYVQAVGIDALRSHEMQLCQRFLDGLASIQGVTLCGTGDLSRRVGVVSVDFLHQDNAEAAFRLEMDYGILTRCGLHCAPSAHKTLDTFPRGTVRFSLGFASTEEDVDAALTAIAAVSEA